MRAQRLSIRQHRVTSLNRVPLVNRPPFDRLIDKRELRKCVPFSAMHIWRLEKQGAFPKRVRIGSNRVGWSEHEVQDWIESRKAARR